MSIGSLIMRIIVYGVLLAVVSNSCTTINIINERLSKLHYIDSALIPYSSKFLEEAKAHNVSVTLKELTMIFGVTADKDSPSTIGTCAPMNGYPVVTIDKKYWEVANEIEREELVFHELGHCLLNRDHCEIKENGESVSLMEPEMIGSVKYSTNRKRLVDELFRSHKGCGEISQNSDGVHLRLHE